VDRKNKVERETGRQKGTKELKKKYQSDNRQRELTKKEETDTKKI
jgi:hypothetical protein